MAEGVFVDGLLSSPHEVTSIDELSLENECIGILGPIPAVNDHYERWAWYNGFIFGLSKTIEQYGPELEAEKPGPHTASHNRFLVSSSHPFLHPFHG